MSETVSQNQTIVEQKIKEIKEETEKIVAEIKEMYKILEDLNALNNEINKKFKDLIERWWCVFDIAFGYYRQDCRFFMYPARDKVIVITDTPSPIKVELQDANNVETPKIKEIIRNELINRFHYQIMETSERLINILEVVKDTINKTIGIKEKYEKVDRLYEKVISLQNRITELEEGVELIKEIEELREERTKLIQEVENLKNLRDDLRDEVKQLQQQLQQLQQQQQ
ncbi:MAG: hypothetical protein QXL19_10575 [Ignisphaera sp.]